MRCLAASFCTALFLYGFMYYGNYRYRLPFEPLMIVVASVLVTRLWQHRRDLRANPEAGRDDRVMAQPPRPRLTP